MVTDPALEARLNDSLNRIHHHLQWIADQEARSAWVKGVAANGALDRQREKLIIATEAILDVLESIGGSPKYHPK